MEEKEFRDWLSAYTDADLFISTILHQRPSFRVNTLKISNETFDAVSNLECKKCAWYADARILEGKAQLGNTFEYFLGYIHPQSLSSMLPPLALAPEEGDYVLDICASPGSKTTQLAALMKNTGTLVANDLPEREIALIPNIARLGVINVICTNKDAKNYPLKNEFKKVLVDAPCTALGSSLNASKRFSVEMASKMGEIQKRIIANAYDALAENGVLIYSTCTVAEEECEGVISWLLENRQSAKVEEITLNVPHERGLAEYGSEIAKTWRVYPQHFGSEGFYLARIKKVV
jgi:NOL1/NOP2/sun family putative RNA methylase